jgi:hypothetical protein
MIKENNSFQNSGQGIALIRLRKVLCVLGLNSYTNEISWAPAVEPIRFEIVKS